MASSQTTPHPPLSHLFSLLVLTLLAKNRKKNSLLALPNPTPKSRNQAMHVTPPRSPSQELSIVLQDCRWCGVSEEIEEGWPSWPPQQFPLACSSERLAPEQQASHAGSKSARQLRAVEQQAHAGAASRVGVASARQPRRALAAVLEAPPPALALRP